jgi:hypothetical protein
MGRVFRRGRAGGRPNNVAGSAVICAHDAQRPPAGRLRTASSLPTTRARPPSGWTTSTSRRSPGQILLLGASRARGQRASPRVSWAFTGARNRDATALLGELDPPPEGPVPLRASRVPAPPAAGRPPGHCRDQAPLQPPGVAARPVRSAETGSPCPPWRTAARGSNAHRDEPTRQPRNVGAPMHDDGVTDSEPDLRSGHHDRRARQGRQPHVDEGAERRALFDRVITRAQNVRASSKSGPGRCCIR